MDLRGRTYPGLFTTYDDDDGGDVSVEDHVVGSSEVQQLVYPHAVLQDSPSLLALALVQLHLYTASVPSSASSQAVFNITYSPQCTHHPDLSVLSSLQILVGPLTP